jgi:hypothetical protein
MCCAHWTLRKVICFAYIRDAGNARRLSYSVVVG